MKNKNLKYALHFLFNLRKANSNKHRISNMSIKFILEHDQINKDFRVFITFDRP